MMREYVTVCTTGILLHATKQVVFITFLTFPSNPSASCPNYFDNMFCQRSLVAFFFYWIKYLYCRISPTSGLITALTRYQGKGSYSIFVAMLCVAVVIVGAI